MSSTCEIKICEVATVVEDDWHKLYDAAFPANERETESKLTQLIAVGRMLYHKTIGKDGELLCFSLVSLAPDFSFLAYLATDPNQRSAGVGSKHMKRLLELLRSQPEGSKGMLLEIDATNPKKTVISEDERKIRQRRLSFYRRLGAKKLCTGLEFLGPSRKSGGTDAELDLLIHPFSSEKLDCQTKRRLVSEIYQRFYCLDLDETLVTTVMGHYDDSVKHDASCAEDTVDPAPVTTPATSSAPVATPAQPPVATPAPTAEAPADTAAESPTAPVSSAPTASSNTANGSLPVVESDCEALEKLGKKVDCECQGHGEPANSTSVRAVCSKPAGHTDTAKVSAPSTQPIPSTSDGATEVSKPGA